MIFTSTFTYTLSLTNSGQPAYFSHCRHDILAIVRRNPQWRHPAPTHPPILNSIIKRNTFLASNYSSCRNLYLSSLPPYHQPFPLTFRPCDLEFSAYITRCTWYRTSLCSTVAMVIIASVAMKTDIMTT